MEKIKGKVIILGNDVDTDQILPGYAMSEPYELIGNYALAGLPTDDFKDNREPGCILVAGRNFGCGSSREQAPISLKQAEVACIVAQGFARIFRRNSINIGLHCRSNGDGVTSPGAGGKDYNTYAANWRYKDQKITTQANEWITYTFEFTVDELMINHQIGMLCMNFGNIGATEYFYIDNIKNSCRSNI